MPTIDTNVLLRWLLNDVPAQSTAAESLLTSGERIQVPDLALMETAYVLERGLRLPRHIVVRSLETVMGLSAVEMNRALWRTALDDYSAHSKLSITDTFLMAQARAADALPLLTFDRKLANQLDGAELLR